MTGGWASGGPVVVVVVVVGVWCVYGGQVYGSFHQTPEGDIELPLLDADKVRSESLPVCPSRLSESPVRVACPSRPSESRT